MDDPTELPQVIVGTCGCLLPTDTKPAGYVFKVSQVPNKRLGRPRRAAKAPRPS